MTKKIFTILTLLTVLTISCEKQSSTVDSNIPEGIATPDTLKTSIGELNLRDGAPTRETMNKVFDNLDLQRATSVYLNNIPLASIDAIRVGLLEFGEANKTAVIYENLVDYKTLFLTPNATSVYFSAWLELTEGEAMVVEIPANILGFMNNNFFEYVTDFGNVGPDKGQGGQYLILPPNYKGVIPEGYHVVKTKTYGNLFFGRGFMVNGDTKPAVESIKKTFRIYPLSQAGQQHTMNFINGSGVDNNTIFRMDEKIFERINNTIQTEPLDGLSSDRLGELYAIGIAKGQDFNPDTRMKKILKDAADIGAVTVRSLAMYPRNENNYIYESKTWADPFTSGSADFKKNNVLMLDDKAIYFFYAIGISPAMILKIVGEGSQYAAVYLDTDGNPFDGNKTYKITLPPNVPAKDNWSFTLYNNQTRAMLPTDQKNATLSSYDDSLKQNKDGSYDIYFAPTPPKGFENNWIQTVPEKGWNMLFRLYGPLEPWFDKSWKLPDPILVK